MPENAIIPDAIIPDAIIPDEAVPETAKAETAKEKFERERLSRRQALKKFGMTSAMATFALFSVDDLARMVGKAMQQRAADNKVVEQVAKEFQQAGIALAYYGEACNDCCNHYNNSINASHQTWCTCILNAATLNAVYTCNAEEDARNNDAQYAYDSPNGCKPMHCTSQGLTCPPRFTTACIQAIPIGDA